MKKAFTKKDIKAITKWMDEELAMQVADIIEDVNLGCSDITSEYLYGTGKNSKAITMLVIFSAIQAADGAPFGHLDEIVRAVARRLDTSWRVVCDALHVTKTVPYRTKFFGKEVTVYDRMGLNTFAID